MATSTYKRAFGRLRARTIGTALTFFRAGRSVYVLVLGFIILALGIVVLITSVNSREAAAAPGGWDSFVAMAGSNQWVSGSFLVAASCIMLSVNYLPRLEGEA